MMFEIRTHSHLSHRQRKSIKQICRFCLPNKREWKRRRGKQMRCYRGLCVHSIRLYGKTRAYLFDYKCTSINRCLRHAHTTNLKWMLYVCTSQSETVMIRRNYALYYSRQVINQFFSESHKICLLLFVSKLNRFKCKPQPISVSVKHASMFLALRCSSFVQFVSKWSMVNPLFQMRMNDMKSIM